SHEVLISSLTMASRLVNIASISFLSRFLGVDRPRGIVRGGPIVRHGHAIRHAVIVTATLFCSCRSTLVLRPARGQALVAGKPALVHIDKSNLRFCHPAGRNSW